MTWQPIEQQPPAPGEYLTATIIRRMIDAKSRVTAVRYMGRERHMWDGQRWDAAVSWTHWRREPG